MCGTNDKNAQRLNRLQHPYRKLFTKSGNREHEPSSWSGRMDDKRRCGVRRSYQSGAQNTPTHSGLGAHTWSLSAPFVLWVLPPSALALAEFAANRVVDNCRILDVVLNDDNVHPAVRKERDEYRTTLSPGGCLSIAMLVLIPSRSFHRASTAAGPHYHSHLRSLSSHWHKLLGANRDDDRNLYGLYILVGEERSGLPSVFSRLLISFFSAPLAPLAPQARTLFSVLLSSSTTTTRKTH